jgi:hypothetical protein
MLGIALTGCSLLVGPASFARGGLAAAARSAPSTAAVRGGLAPVTISDTVALSARGVVVPAGERTALSGMLSSWTNGGRNIARLAISREGWIYAESQPILRLIPGSGRIVGTRGQAVGYLRSDGAIVETGPASRVVGYLRARASGTPIQVQALAGGPVVVGRIPPNGIVTVTGLSRGGYLVRLQSGRSGWIDSTAAISILVLAAASSHSPNNDAEFRRTMLHSVENAGIIWPPDEDFNRWSLADTPESINQLAVIWSVDDTLNDGSTSREPESVQDVRRHPGTSGGARFQDGIGIATTDNAITRRPCTYVWFVETHCVRILLLVTASGAPRRFGFIEGERGTIDHSMIYVDDATICKIRPLHFTGGIADVTRERAIRVVIEGECDAPVNAGQSASLVLSVVVANGQYAWSDRLPPGRILQFSLHNLSVR